MNKIILIKSFVVVLVCCIAISGINAQVATVSNLIVKNYNVGEPKIKKISVCFVVDNKEMTSKLTIEASDSDDFAGKYSVMFDYYLTKIENSYFAIYNDLSKYALGNDNMVEILIDARDQRLFPYSYFRVTATDNLGKQSTAMFYRKNNEQ